MLAVLALPTASAHAFAELPKNYPLPLALNRDNWHEVPIYQQLDPVPQDGLFILTAAAGYPVNSDATGPANVQISMRAAIDGERENIETWTVPVDGLSRMYATRAVAAPNITLNIETLSPDDIEMVFLMDYHGGTAVRSLPFWTDAVRSLQLRNGNALYAYDATDAGRLEAVVKEPALFGLGVRVLRDDGGAWPSGFTEVAASSHAATDRTGVASHRLEWEGEAGKTYYLLATATRTYNPGSRSVPDGLFLPDQMEAHIGPAPHESPGPAVLAALALLGVAALLARRRA